jgi:hypothetical protein
MSALPDPATRTAVPATLANERSIGELMGDVTRDLATLLRQEVELAKAELRESTTQAGKGAGLLTGAGVAGFLAVLFVSIALWWGLGTVMGNAWSAVVVALIWGIAAAVLVSSGRRELTRVRGLPKTAETMSKIPNALKGNEEENR